MLHWCNGHTYVLNNIESQIKQAAQTIIAELNLDYLDSAIHCAEFAKEKIEMLKELKRLAKAGEPCPCYKKIGM